MAFLNFIKSLVSENEGEKEYREKLSSVLSDSKLTREEEGILTAGEFPTYFTKKCDFDNLIEDWLNYNEEAR